MDLTIVMIKAFIGAFLWAVFGYLSRQGDEDFQPEKLLSTILAAVVVAFLDVAYGIDPETGELLYLYYLLKTGIVGVIDKFIKTIWRRWLRQYWVNFTEGDPQ